MVSLRAAAQQALEALEDAHANHNITYAGTIYALRAALAESEQDWSLLGATQESLREHMAEIQRLRAALAEPQEPDVPEVCFGNIPVGWLESPHGEFRKNLLYKLEFPSQLLSWQIPLYAHLRAALAEPAAPDFCDTHCTWLDHAPGCVRHEEAPTVVKPVALEALVDKCIATYAAHGTSDYMIVDDGKARDELLSAIRAATPPRAPTVVEPVAWASPSVIPLREGKNNDPCVLTDTRCAANTVPLYATAPQRKPLTDAEILKLYKEHEEKLRGGGTLFHFTEFARAVIAASGGLRNE